jgi:hypothetical protein
MRVLRSMGVLAAVGVLVAVLGSVSWGQTSGTGGGRGVSTPPPQIGGPTGITVPPAAGPDIALPPQMEADQARMRAVDRQKQLVSDTQKLLALATQLKTDVDKSNKDMLSLDVVRKADEIEKLAHSVKERMKGN